MRKTKKIKGPKPAIEGTIRRRREFSRGWKKLLAQTRSERWKETAERSRTNEEEKKGVARHSERELEAEGKPKKKSLPKLRSRVGKR